MNQNPWYRDWFGSDYLNLYQHRSPEEAAKTISWLIEVLNPAENLRILDLACGSGRHSAILHAHGFDVTGLDLSWPLLKKARQYRNMKLLRGDMRNIPIRPQKFDLALSLFTSFGYFQDDAENLRVLQEVSRVLKTGGKYVLDFLNEAHVRTSVVPSDETEINGKPVRILRWIDDRRNRIEKRILISEAERAFREYRESVKLYSKQQLISMLASVSIEPLSIYGDYCNTPFTSSSPRLIIVGEKHGS